MPQEIAIKIEKQTHCKRAQCGDEIFWNTHKKFIYCTRKKIWVDACRQAGLLARP
ncbi:MAG: hypothetical protein AAB404_00275 [Patescibacteria group bacterium]